MRSLYCRIVGHKINRHRVWHDSLDYRTACDRCAQVLLRGRRGWRPFDMDRDADARRNPHPNHTA